MANFFCLSVKWFVFSFISEQPKKFHTKMENLPLFSGNFVHYDGLYIILLEISCEDELPIFKRSLLNFSTRYDASSIVKQKGTVFQWHLPKWSMIESRNICMYFSFEFPALIFTLHHFLKIRIIYVSTLILLYDLLYDILFKMSYKPR